jgi:hypothetical protein
MTNNEDSVKSPAAVKEGSKEEEEKPNREYSIKILNAIQELKREEWNGLLDENSR